MQDDAIPVLIAGGGPVGLALAYDLAWRGIRSMLVERDAGTSLVLLAKAGVLNERTMEICRRWGIADRIAHCGIPEDAPRDTFYCTALNGFLLGCDPMPAVRDRLPPPQGPEFLRKCPQFLFDPILAEAARGTGLVEIRYATRLVGFADDGEGVSAELEDLASGRRSTVRARYLAGCDGAGSLVRKQLGIGFPGPDLGQSASVMVRIPDLERYHPLGIGERYMFIGRSGTWANLTAVDQKDLWRFTLFGKDMEDPERIDYAAALRRAFGRDDVPFEILRVMLWRRSQCLAESYGRGRVVLAGDACHTTSPTGGHGLNTGIGDVVGLGWVLEALLRGWGGPGLLAAYEAERRPVALRNASASTRNFKAWVGAGDWSQVMDAGAAGAAARAAIGAQMSAQLQPEWHSLGIGMGYRYENSPIIVPDGTPPTPDDASDYVQTARPGHRAPHARRRDGSSVIDLFGHGFVLLRFHAGTPVADMQAAAESAGVPLTLVDIDEAPIAALYERRLCLVRPDGHVAWRGDALPPDSAGLLDIVRGAAVNT